MEDEIVKVPPRESWVPQGESERSDDERTSRARKTTTKSKRKRNIDYIRAPTRGVSERGKDKRGIERRKVNDGKLSNEARTDTTSG